MTSNERAACVEAIDTYRQEHMVPTVVCSRQIEYLTQTKRVTLRNAVVVQPLTVQQIDAYLSSAGSQLAAVRVALSEDEVLRELARTPLMLNILTLTYQGKAVDDQVKHMPPDVQRLHVLGTYVERMLKRRAASRYTPEQTKYWLAWLARQMVQHGQAEFYLERMQPNWLEEPQSLRNAYRATVRMGTGLLFGLLFGLLSGLFGGLLWLLFGGLLSGCSSLCSSGCSSGCSVGLLTE